MPMDQRLYLAAKEGDMKVLEEYKDQFATQLTPCNNTVLHVAAKYNGFSREVDPTDLDVFITMAVKELVVSLNSIRDTCIHLAARHGQPKFIAACIKYVKRRGISYIELGGVKTVGDLLTIPNNYGNTALHEALLKDRPDTRIVELLVKEDANFNHTNKDGKSPLYLAVEAGDKSCVKLLLNNCSSPSYAGPHGTTALHVAAMHPDAEFVEMILGKESIPGEESILTKQADDLGWNALHFAAYLGFELPVKALLTADKRMAYDTTKEENKTPLHLAAVNDKEKVIVEIFEKCPDAIEAVTSKGQTILHLLAYALGRSKAGERCNYQNVLGPYLENQRLQRDLVGNMPLDVGLEGQKSVLSHPCLKQHYDLLDSFNERSKQKRSKYEKKLKERTDVWKERANTHLIVATLIITVSFAAGFTIPGGYDSDDRHPTKGMAILWKKAAFQAFAITDTIAMISSTAAVFLLYLVTYERENKRLKRYEAAGTLVMVAMVAMMIAFMTGLYAVLPSPSVAIFICVICSLSLTIFLFFLGRTLYGVFTEARKMLREE